MPSERPSDESDSGALASVAKELTGRVQELADRMASARTSGVSGLGGLAGQFRSVVESSSAMAKMPIRQVQLIADMIDQQRAQLQRLQQQLAVFDEQLKVLGDAVKPVLEWGEQWGRTQDTILGALRNVGKGTAG